MSHTATDFPLKSELRESKDEIVVGELIAGLTRHGWVCTRIESEPNHHELVFRLPDDAVLSAAHVAVDRRQHSALVAAGGGSKTLLGFAAHLASSGNDPAQMQASWRESAATSMTPPIAGEVRIERQASATVARTYHLVDLDDYVQGTNVGTSALVDWAKEQIDQLRDSLRPLAR